MAGDRLELIPEAKVMAADGVCGTVDQFLADPLTGCVKALVVQPGLLSRGQVVVPFEYVRDTHNDEVRLRISCTQVRALPAYQPGGAAANTGGQQARVMGSGRAGAGLGLEQQLAVRVGQQVRSLDGYAGRMTRLLIDLKGKVHHLVVRTWGVAGSEVVVPVDWVHAVNPLAVQLKVPRHELQTLPRYRPDHDIGRDVERAFRKDETLRRSDLSMQTVSVHDGVVTLRGHVMDSAHRARAGRVASSVRGVLAVENELVPDDELVTLVVQALSEEKHLRGQTVSVAARYGVITLNGHVANQAARTAAEVRAASVPWVCGVSNYLAIPGAAGVPDQRVLQPRTGQTVHATDMRLGEVEKVILDPCNRRVAGVVVTGHFPNPAYSRLGLRSYKVPMQERCVMIPLGAIARVGPAGVMLGVDAIVSADYEDFDPAQYVTPPPEWRPPYPYHLTELLLTGDPPRIE